jgi:hypothetical protein
VLVNLRSAHEIAGILNTGEAEMLVRAITHAAIELSCGQRLDDS